MSSAKQNYTPESHGVIADSLGSLRHTTSKQTTRYGETSRYDTRPSCLSFSDEVFLRVELGVAVVTAGMFISSRDSTYA